MNRFEEKVEEEIKKACAKIYPLQNILIRKVKVLKKTRFDASKMIELYGEKSALATEILSQGAIQVEQPANIITQSEKK